MPRTVTSAFNTRLSAQITSPGYLVRIDTNTVRYWSNIGQVQYPSGGQVYSDVDFKIDGISYSPDSDLSCTLTIQNLDGVASAIFMNAAEKKMEDIAVTIYQFERGALASGDAPRLGVLDINDCDNDRKVVRLALKESKGNSEFCPRRRINSINGFSYAIPAGTRLAWGGEFLILEPSDG